MELVVAIGIARPVMVPALVTRGSVDGPLLVVTSGVHGDEFEGIVAAQEVFRELDPALLSGTFVALCVCNPLALEAGSRETPGHAGGGNLARVFPGNAGGTATERLAFDLFGALARWLGADDLLIDLHSGGTRQRLLPLVGYRDIAGRGRQASEKAARAFGESELWEIADTPGALTSELARIGLACIGTEAPGQGGCEPADWSRNVRGVRRILGHLDMTRDAHPELVDGQAKRSTQVHNREAGLFVARASLGQDVTAGQVVAEIRDAFGTCIESVRAPLSGTIWGLRSFGSTWPHEPAFWIGSPSVADGGA